MASGSIYKVALLGSDFFGNDLVTTLHYRAEENTIFDTQAQDLAQAVVEDLEEPFLDTFAGGCTLNGITVRGVTDPLEGWDEIFNTPQSGTVAGDPMPTYVSPRITWLTGVVGRRFRGRQFLWPITDSVFVVNAWTSAFEALLNSYASAANLIGDGIGTAQYQQVVYSRTYDIATPVVSHRINPYPGTQRRRSPGVGS